MAQKLHFRLLRPTFKGSRRFTHPHLRASQIAQGASVDFVDQPGVSQPWLGSLGCSAFLRLYALPNLPTVQTSQCLLVVPNSGRDREAALLFLQGRQTAASDFDFLKIFFRLHKLWSRMNKRKTGYSNTRSFHRRDLHILRRNRCCGFSCKELSHRLPHNRCCACSLFFPAHCLVKHAARSAEGVFALSRLCASLLRQKTSRDRKSVV